MATIRQQKLAKAIVENVARKQPLPKRDLVVNAGYSTKTATQASKQIIESEGVKESLVSFGFNPDKAKEVVAEILIGGENDTVKLKAADMIFNVHGTYAPKKQVNLNIEQTHDSRLDALIEELENKLDDPQGTTISP